MSGSSLGFLLFLLKICLYCASKSSRQKLKVPLQSCFAALFLNRFYPMRSPCTRLKIKKSLKFSFFTSSSGSLSDNIALISQSSMLQPAGVPERVEGLGGCYIDLHLLFISVFSCETGAVRFFENPTVQFIYLLFI